VGFRANVKKLREAMKWNGWTYKELANSTKLDISSLQKAGSKGYFKRGRGHSKVFLEKIEKALDMMPGEAFFDKPKVRLRGTVFTSAAVDAEPTEGRGSAVERSAKSCSQYIPLRTRLSRCHIHPSDNLRNEALLDRFGAEFAIGDVILDSRFDDFRGLRPEQIVVEHCPGMDVYPRYVLDQRAKMSLRPGDRNLPTAYLTEWRAPVLDQGGTLTMFIGRTDFLTCKAVEACAETIKGNQAAGVHSFEGFPRSLGVHIVVITADNHLILCLRRPGMGWSENDNKWTASICECVNGRKDADRDGRIRPDRAVRRALQEKDELKLPKELVDTARIRFAALATDWKYLWANLIVVVRVEAGHRFVHDHFQRGENRTMSTMLFTIENGLRLVQEGSYAKEGEVERKMIIDPSRMCILVALFHRFGYEKVFKALGEVKGK
jgi:hypothetical protein